MEVLILRYSLKLSSLLFLLIFYFFYIFFIKEISLKNDHIFIDKNQGYKEVIDQNLEDNSINLWIYKLVLRFILLIEKKIYFGKFNLQDNNNFIDLIKTITSYSNYYEKLTIVEGWTKPDLNNLLRKNFNEYVELEYNQVIADTYYFNYGSSFNDLKLKLIESFDKIKEKYQKTELIKKFSFNEILVIGSLLEKEGLDYEDKKIIYSVIINRLDKNMKLQIDATVIYAFEQENIKFNGKLTYNDLKIKHPYNTYFIYGLPPQPISYVGLKTIELIFENYSTNYLFYFYNTLENKHIYSINYKNHLKKLNEYRSKK